MSENPTPAPATPEVRRSAVLGLLAACAVAAGILVAAYRERKKGPTPEEAINDAPNAGDPDD
jgi:hypothetical protein